MENIKISVIMPALNEEAAVADSIKSCLSAFMACGLSGEVVVVNDGSTDRTGEIISGISKEFPDRVKMVVHEKPMGVGRSFMDGSKAARGEGVVMVPGDNENDPRQILCYANMLDACDIIVPFVVNKEVRPAGRNVLSSLFAFIVNFTFGTTFKYTNGTVIYRTSVLREIETKTSGFFFQAETLVKAAKLGYLIAEVPYFLSKRVGGSSKAISFNSLKKVISGYVSLIRDIYFSDTYRYKPERIAKDSQRAKRRI